MFPNTKGPGASFQAAVFVEFFDGVFSFVMWQNWPHLINRLYLLPKLFSEMYFLFYALAFDDIIKFENGEF